LVKIENGDNSENEENLSSNSLNQYNKTAFKELYGETENDISDGEEYGEEIKEIKENKENDQNETEEDEKMVPNNIKKVFSFYDTAVIKNKVTLVQEKEKKNMILLLKITLFFDDII